MSVSFTQGLLKRVHPQKLIKKYFEQLTSGCGRSVCNNQQCVNGGHVKMSTDEAAALALRFLKEQAQICDVFELDPSPTLSYEFLLQVVTACRNEYLDFKPLTRILSQVFSSTDLLSESFLLTENESEIDDKRPESILPVDHKQAIKAYNLLLGLSEEVVENAMINGINALGNRIEIELKTNRKTFTKRDLNQFVIILLNPNLMSPEYLECGLPNMLNALASLPTELQCTLVRYWSKFSSDELQNLLDVFQQMITMRILTGPHATTGRPVNDDPPITNSAKCMRLVYYASLLGGKSDQDVEYILPSLDVLPKKDKVDSSIENSARLFQNINSNEENSSINDKELIEMLNINELKCRKPLIPFKNFMNECLNDVIEMDRDFMHFKEGASHSFLNYPFILSTVTKISGLFFDNRVRMYSERRLSVLYGLVHGHMPSPYLKLKVRRDHLIQDALVRLEMVAQDQPEDFKKQFVVEFEGEQGIDEGGVSKEFFQLVIEELFNPDFGMFEFNNENNTCWFNPSSFETENQFTLIGLLFGIAIYNSCILDVHFPPVLYRKLLGIQGRYQDLEASHPGIYIGLKNLLEHDGDVAKDILSTFEVTYDVFGSPVQHELVKDGKNVPVTNENRQEFVQRYADFLLNSSVKKQFDAFKRGFDTVTHDSILKRLFRPDELELLVCGSQIFDIQDLFNTTEYDGGYTKDSPVIKFFWEAVNKMSMEQHKQLLNFTTGSDRVPVGGLSKLKLIIAKNGEDSDRLPTAHTCFNVLLLPEYKTYERLEERLLKAIANAKGFGLM